MCGGGGGLLSFATGGLSDIAQGNPWGSGLYDQIQEIIPGNAGRTVGSLVDPFGSTITEVSRADGIPEMIDAAADPTHSVNYSLEGIGKALPAGVRQMAPAIGSIVGTAIYPVAGTAAGYGVGAHIAGQDSKQAQMGAGLSATTAWAANAASGLMSQTPAQAAASAKDPELAYILSDMGNSTKDGYAGTLGAAGAPAGAAAGTPLVYGSPQFYEAAAEVGMTPAEAMKLPVSYSGLLKDIAVKVGPKLLSSALAGGAPQMANLITNTQAPKLANYQQTNNTWSVPDVANQQLAQLSAEAQTEELRRKKKKEEDERQAYLKDYISNIPAKSDYLSDHLG
jgi:hypothetical protein